MNAPAWLLPVPTAETRAELYRSSRTTYHRQWREENRDAINKYWRRHYKRNHAERRAYLNKKQREYRAAAKAA